MAFDWGDDPLGEREIVSVHKAVGVFNDAAAGPGGNGGRRSLAQLKLLSDAHCLGYSYVSRTEAETRYHRREVIEGLARQPVWTREGLVARLAGAFDDAPAALVLRQLHRQDIPPEEQEMYGPGGEVVYHRAWYGYDRRMDRSADPAERAQQDDASREMWHVAPARIRMVQAAAAAGQALPLIVSVGGLIVTCREILGFDEARGQAGRLDGKAFLVRPAGAWAEPLVDTWLDSGAGKAALWWDLR